MHCKVKGCPVSITKPQSEHWKKDRLCAYHAALLKPDQYPQLVRIVKPVLKEVAKALLIS